MKLTKHVGIDASNLRISLIMTNLPNTEDCLIVYPDTLPSDLKDSFFHIMNSDEGQRETDLAEALSRRLYSDTRSSVLQSLHTLGFIKKVTIDSITMMPSPAYKIPLREVLVKSGIISAGIAADDGADKFNPYAYNANAANVGEALGTANNLLAEATMLEQAAASKREQAYNIAPSLRQGFVAPKVESVDFPNNPVLAPEVELPKVDLVAAFTDDLVAEQAGASSAPTE